MSIMQAQDAQANIIKLTHMGLSMPKKAVIIEPKINNALSQLITYHSLCMLPIAGKSLLQLWIEHLTLANFDELVVVVRDSPHLVRQFVTDGTRWGLDIIVRSIPTAMSDTDFIQHIRKESVEPLLVSFFNVIPKTYISQYFYKLHLDGLLNQSSQQRDDSACLATFYIGSKIRFQATCRGNKNTDHHASSCGDNYYPLTESDFIEINSPSELFEANCAFIKQQLDDPLVVGFTNEYGLFTDIGTQIKRNVKVAKPVRIGKHCLIEKDVNIKANVIIGDDVIIEQGCELENVLIFSKSHVGNFAQLKNVVVDGQRVYDIQTNTTTWISDPAILGWNSTYSLRVSLVERVLAACAVMLGSPIILFHWLVCLLQKKPSTIMTEIFIPDGRDFFGQIIQRQILLPSLNIHNKQLRRLPWFLHVVRGDIHIVGTSISEIDCSIPEWAHELREQRPGIINYEMASDTLNSKDLFYIDDLYYVANRSLILNLKLTAKWFMSMVKQVITNNTLGKFE